MFSPFVAGASELGRVPSSGAGLRAQDFSSGYLDLPRTSASPQADRVPRKLSSAQERGFERRHSVDGAEEQFGEGARQASLFMEAFHVPQ